VIEPREARDDLLAVLATVPERAADLASELDGPRLQYRHGPGFPTVAEMIGHVCEVGIALDALLRRLALDRVREVRLREAMEPVHEPDLLPPMEQQLGDFARARRRTIDLLHGMPASFWDEELLDPAQGRVSVQEVVEQIIRHELGHLTQLQSLVALLPVS
jgi:hypothetical protein